MKWWNSEKILFYLTLVTGVAAAQFMGVEFDSISLLGKAVFLIVVMLFIIVSLRLILVYTIKKKGNTVGLIHTDEKSKEE